MISVFQGIVCVGW